MNSEKIDRINTLAHKQKAVGLNDDELKEQAKLRKEYIQSVKANLRGQLNHISIKEKDGSVTDLGEKFGKK
jgi:5-formyltetrahydrofolate cyclo-ligase